MAQVTDPVCGMSVDTEKAAAKAEHGGETYYFCSEACRKKFAAEPGRYAREPGPERHEPRYTTKGFTAPKFGAAGSGGAEFEPLPEAHEDEP